MDEYQTYWSLKGQAHRSYKTAAAAPADWDAARHYERGWKQGYMDVAQGSDGCAPATPPHCYWSFKYQNAAGHAAIETWYSGYRDGAQTALGEGVQQYNYLPSPHRIAQSPLGANVLLEGNPVPVPAAVTIPETLPAPPPTRLPPVDAASEAEPLAPPEIPTSPFEGPVVP